MQISRLFEIVYTLLDKRHVTTGELANRFGVSKRTIMRDLDALTVAGIPIETTVGSGGGVSITPVAFLVIQEGNVKVLQIQSFANAADRVVGMVPDVLDRVSGFVSGMGKKGETPSPAPEAPAPEN